MYTGVPFEPLLDESDIPQQFGPEFVTFTGLDEKTDLDRVLSLSKKYPIEWGILFSKSNTGKVQRYPSLEVASKFFDVSTGTFHSGLVLSAHICGKYSNKIFSDDVPLDFITFLKGHFFRTQINVADGESHVNSGHIKTEKAVKFASDIGAKKAIIQCTKEFPIDNSVDWLYDTSGGIGVLPDSWDAKAYNTTAFCGYAGGISSERVDSVLNEIKKVHPQNSPFWIDMESRVRTNEWLDLDKCEAVLRKVYPHVK